MVQKAAKVNDKRFLELVERSKLVDKDQLEEALSDCRELHGGQLPEDVNALADCLIESGILTINESRKVLGLGPVSWGNVPVRKKGVSPVGANGEKEAGDEDDSECES